MNSDVKKLWIEALRSGQYRQARNTLRFMGHDGPSYCCLGVLCELYRQQVGAGQWDDSNSYLGETSYLPPDVAEWAGLECTQGEYGDPDDSKSLTEDNDGSKTVPAKDFKAIADIIEEKF